MPLILSRSELPGGRRLLVVAHSVDDPVQLVTPARPVAELTPAELDTIRRLATGTERDRLRRR